MSYNIQITDKLGGFSIPTAIADADGVDQFLADGVKDIIENCRKYKPQLIPLFTKTLSQSGNTLANIPNMDILRIHNTISDGSKHLARFVTMDELVKAAISGSIYESTEKDPIWSIVSGTLTVLPSTSSSYQFTYVDPQTVDASVAPSITNPTYFPTDLHNILVLYATIKVLNYISLSRAKEASDRIDTAKDKIDALFVATTDEPDILDIQNALDNAQKLIDIDLTDDDAGTAAESALYWLGDEDTDMVSSTLSVAAAEITRANTIMAAMDKKSTSLSKYTELVAIYIQDIQAVMTLTRELKMEYKDFFQSDQSKGAQNEA